MTLLASFSSSVAISFHIFRFAIFRLPLPLFASYLRAMR